MELSGFYKVESVDFVFEKWIQTSYFTWAFVSDLSRRMCVI